MKALRIYGGRDLRYEDVADPYPGHGLIKIRIHLAGICGSDVKEYSTSSGLIPVDKIPLTIGHEFMGRVAEVGEGVNEFNVGDRVSGVGYRYCDSCFYCKRGLYNLCLKSHFMGMDIDGCMADYVIAPAYATYKLPDSISDECGTLVEPLAVSIHAIRQGKINPGDVIAIVGDGTIGLGTLLAAKVSGASAVYLVSKHENRGKLALEIGASKVIYLSDTDPVQSIKDLTDGLGADVVVECVGNPDSLQLAVNLARRGGTIVLVGVATKPSSINFGEIMFFEKNIIGSAIYIHEAKTAIAMLADRRMDPSCLITSIAPLKNAVEKGFEKLLSNKENNLKILLRP